MSLTTRVLAAASVLVIAASAFAGTLTDQPSPTLVADGQAKAVIVTAAQPSESAKRATDELVHFVKLMSGAELPVMTDAQFLEAKTDQPALLVGRSKVLDGLKLDIPAGDDRLVTKEGFVVKTVGRYVVLAGNEDSIYRGTEYAVYELLEQLGCRWYYPGEFGQVVPEMKTITVGKLDIRQSPSFALRNIWLSGWADQSGDHPQWLVRNKGTTRGGFAFPGDGTIHRLAPVEQYGESDPDIYAVGQDGKRQNAQTPGHLRMLCVTNPRTVEVAATTIKTYFKDNPDANSYGFSAPDGSPRCLCERCVAADHAFKLDSGLDPSISDAYFNFVNNVAHAVFKDYPDRYLIVLVYANRVRPPEGLDKPWHKNIIIQLARLRISAQRAIEDDSFMFSRRHRRTLDAWSRICPNILIYDYDPHADLSRMPFWTVTAIRRNMPFYHQHHVIGFTSECNNTFMRTGLNYFMRAKLMWDVDADVDAMLVDFYTKFFEDAAAPMETFIESIEHMLATSEDAKTWTSQATNWEGIYPAREIEKLGALLDQAESLAKSPAAKTHVKAYRVLHDYMTTYQRIYTCLHDGDYAGAVKAYESIDASIEAMKAIQPGLLPPDPGWVTSEGSSMAGLGKLVRLLDDRTSGKAGTLVALAPKELPFRTDPDNVGLFEQWQLPEIGAQVDWRAIPANLPWAVSGYHDEQGRPYEGLGWYRFTVSGKNVKPGQPVHLTIPTMPLGETWVWMNGHLVCSPTSQSMLSVSRRIGTLDIPVTERILAGKDNVVTVRIRGSVTRSRDAGITTRPLLWSPNKTD